MNTTTPEPDDWAGTTDNMFDLHRFGPDRHARCTPEIRTHSLRTDHDATREPYATLRTRQQIEDTGFGHMYRFCPTCTSAAVPSTPEA